MEAKVALIGADSSTLNRSPLASYLTLIAALELSSMSIDCEININRQVLAPIESIRRLSSNMNTSLNQLTAALPNYCVLPSQHSHSVPTDFFEQLLDEDEEDSILSAVNKQDETNDNQQIDNAKAPLALLNAASVTNKSPSKQQLLDPYIDAVQVKSRINNKRGARVRAAPAMEIRDHEPHSSYYSKTVHVVEAKEDAEEWDLSDMDDHDDYHDHHHGKKKKKKKVYVKKKKYPKKRKKKKGRHQHHYQLGHKHGHYHHAKKKKKKHHHHDYNGKKSHYPKTKKTYAYVYLGGKGDEKHNHGHDDDDHDHDEQHSYGKHHYHHGGKKSGKLVHLDLIDKSKMSIAGLLGYTLLCVNYLLVLQQPTYDKYTGHYYTKYSPHGGKGDMVELKSGGPVILAHCSDLPEPRGLIKAASLANSTTRLVDVNATQIEQSNASSALVLAPQSNVTNQLATGDSEPTSRVVEVSRADYPPSTGSPSSSAASPPAYYYTLSPTSHSSSYSSGYDDDFSSLSHYDDYTTRSNGLLSPIQYYLNRLLLPASTYSDYNSDEHDYSPIQVVGSPPSSRYTGNGGRRKKVLLKTPSPVGGDLRSGRLTSGALVASRGRLGGLNGRLILVDGQPQVVGTKDNLVDLRTRQVEVSMQVTRRRFTGAQRAISLNEDDEAEWRRGPNDGLGVQVPVAVRRPLGGQPLVATDNNQGARPQSARQNEEDRMQADQPEQRNNEAGSGNRSPSDNQILDLPEYALSGDSIELTCNHRVPVHRLYSVKWFKDSLEFYRFIPANGPRMKSSLFLQDVRLDLARSNSDTLYLRNVTHRTSGLYRCEVVSEGPSFETLSGEKRMQVYALPDNGPQLRLAEAGEFPAGAITPTPPPLAPLTAIGQLSARRPVSPVLLDNSSEQPWPGSQLERLQDGLQQSASGPIIRCLSARSSPVAQLRFSINNQPISLSRTLENSTTTYSDGMESNLVSFRLTLPDFVLSSDGARFDDTNASLDRAASLKSNSSQSDSAVKQSQTTTTSTSTSTTTSTTVKPKPTDAKARDKSGRQYANANVLFDDLNVAMKKSDFKVDTGRANAKLDRKSPLLADGLAGANKANKTATDNQKKRKLKKPNTARRPVPVVTDSEEPDDEDDTGRPVTDQRSLDDERGEEESAAMAAALPVGPDKPNRKWELGQSSIDSVDPANYTTAQTGGQRRRRSPLSSYGNHYTGKPTTLVGSSEMGKSESQMGHRMDRVDGGAGDNNERGYMENKRHQTSSAAPASANPEAEFVMANQQLQRLARQEQRTRPTGANGNIDDANESQTEQLYSNYIRIKCTSLVPAVGYEMTSELSVPLTVLVPGRQISDAFRQSQPAGQSTGGRQRSNLDDATPSGGRRLQQQQQRRRPSEDGEPLFGPSRSGAGSLQAPRAVIIDRLAQASGPPARNSARPDQVNPAQTVPNQQQQQADRAVAVLRHRSNATSNHDKVRHLEELAKKRRNKAASNGSALSALSLMRNLMGFSSRPIRGIGCQANRHPRQDCRFAPNLASILAGLSSLPYQVTIPLVIALWLLVHGQTSPASRIR